MEYTKKEKEILSLIEKTDFKNLGKKEFFRYASKLDELRPEVAIEALRQYPEVANLLKSSLIEYRGMLDKIIDSDNSSLEHAYSIIDSAIANDNDSRKEFIDLANKIRSDYSKLLDNPNLTEEERKELYNKEIEILRLVDNKDKEIRESETEKVKIVEKKDSEKRLFNWKTIAAASFVVVTFAGISVGALGGKFDFDLPRKS